MSSPVSREYNAFVSRFAWLRITVCFVVFSASGSGGLGGWRDFGPVLVVEGCPGVLGVGGVVGVGAVVCLLHHRWVTGMKAEATDA